MVLTNHVWDFCNFENRNVNEFYSFWLTWDPKGVKIAKRYSSYKSQPKVFKLFLNFPPDISHKTTMGIFEILRFLIFNELRKKTKTSIIWKRSGRRAKTEWHLGLVGSSSTHIGYLWPFNVQCHFGVNWCTFDFSKNGISPKMFLQVAAKIYQTSLNYLIWTYLNYLIDGPHKTAFEDFEILKIEILLLFFFFFFFFGFG